MVNKKGQGISITFIVVAAIAALVLVLVIAFTMGGLGNFFDAISGGGQIGDKEITDAQLECKNYCSDAKNKGYGAWASTNYCINKFPIDVNGDDVIDPDTEMLSCYDPEIGVDCMLTEGGNLGASVSCDFTDCPSEAHPLRKCCGVGCGDSTLTYTCGDIINQQTCNTIPGCAWDTTVSPAVCGGAPTDNTCSSLNRVACNEASAGAAAPCDGWSQMEWDTATNSCV